MKRSLGYLSAVVALLLLAGSACGNGSSAAVRSSEESSPALGAEAPARGERTDVGDPDGKVRGSFSEAEQDARRQRISLRVVEEKLFGAPSRADAETRARILHALAVLEPVEVHDDDGKLTGYLTDRFVSLADYPAARDKAGRELEQYSLAP